MARTTPKKPKPDPIAREFFALDALAERKYREALDEHQGMLVAAEKRNEHELHNPAFCEDLGLPAVLPEFTISVLKRTMALDRHGDDVPDPRRVYAAYGCGDDRPIVKLGRPHPHPLGERRKP